MGVINWVTANSRVFSTKIYFQRIHEFSPTKEPYVIIWYNYTTACTHHMLTVYICDMIYTPLSQDDPLGEQQSSQYESELLGRQSAGAGSGSSSSSLASEQLEESLSAMSLPEGEGGEARGWQLSGDSLNSSMDNQQAAGVGGQLEGQPAGVVEGQPAELVEAQPAGSQQMEGQLADSDLQSAPPAPPAPAARARPEGEEEEERHVTGEGRGASVHFTR